MLFQTKLFKQSQEPTSTVLLEYWTVRQSRHVEVALATTAKIAYEGLHRQDDPLLDGIWKGSWQMQAPEFVEFVKTQTRVEGHWQLLVPTIGPELNVTVRQLRHKLPMRTLVVKSQMHCPPLIT